MQQFILTIQRHGEEPRIKGYTYEKAAHDGFDTAVLRKGRLASTITLDELVDDSPEGTPTRTNVRTWSRSDLPTGPTVLYLLTDANDEAVEVITDAHPSIEDVRLTPFPLAWGYEAGALADDPDSDTHKLVHYTTAERLAKMVKEGLFDSTHAIHAFWLPDHNAELMVQFVAAYHRRYGRFPFVVDSYYTDRGYVYTLVDLNKVSG